MTDHVDVVAPVDHAHYEEVSWAPFAVVVGITLLVPLAFVAYFVYKLPFLATVSAGLGTPLLLAGIAKWIHEGATQPSAVSGLSPIGIGVFIIGEILIFIGLFASYWTMRIGYGTSGGVWPPEGTPHINLVLPLIMTVILVASSMTYHYAEHLLDLGRKASFQLWLIISIVLGSAFLACTAYEYAHLVNEGFLPSTNLYGSAFYSLTGFHGSHVLVGLLSFLAIFISMLFGNVHSMFVKVAGIYWHFVDVIWFFVASQVYFW